MRLGLWISIPNRLFLKDQNWSAVFQGKNVLLYKYIKLFFKYHTFNQDYSLKVYEETSN